MLEALADLASARAQIVIRELWELASDENSRDQVY